MEAQPYGYTGWHNGESECDPPEPDKRWLAIVDDEDNELAVIVQRKERGEYRTQTSLFKLATAQMIVEAMNAYGRG